MRPRALPLLLVLAAVPFAVGCSGSGQVVPGKSPTVQSASPLRVRCDQVILQTGPVGGRLVLGLLAVPPAYLPPAVPTGTGPWRYFRKYGLTIRAGSPAVVVSVPSAWRRRVAIVWGSNTGGVSSLRLLSCRRQVGAWNGYAGGFYLQVPSACVPLVFQFGRRTMTIRFGIGRSCGSVEPRA